MNPTVGFISNSLDSINESNQRKFHAMADRINPLGAHLHAIAEPENLALRDALRASRDSAPSQSRGRARETRTAGRLTSSRRSMLTKPFDENLRQLDEKSELLHRR